MQMQRATFGQGVSRLQPFVPKQYQSLKLRVENALAWYLCSEILVYLHGIAYLSHKQTPIFDVFTLWTFSFIGLFHVRLQYLTLHRVFTFKYQIGKCLILFLIFIDCHA